MKKILVIQTAFLGDVILATPLAENLKLTFPEAEIHFLVKKGNESLLMNHRSIHKVWVFDKKNGKMRNMWTLAKSFRQEGFDLVFNLHRFASSGIIAALSNGKQLYGFKKNPFSFLYTQSFPHEIGNGQHEVDRNLSLLKPIGITHHNRRPLLFPSQVDQDKVASYQSEPYFCIAPASVWFTKQLPKSIWIELVIALAAKGKVYVLGSPQDFELCQEIIVASKTNSVNLAGELSLLQSAALMQKANRNFVNDSGPLHLASAVNAKVTAFFCSTIPDFGFGPLSDEAEIRQTTENLSCRPCGLHGHMACPKGHFKCGNISVEFN
ncbi:MAG: glycosyltransferase family 9 protein [Crocinitomicaceae bacterium]